MAGTACAAVVRCVCTYEGTCCHVLQDPAKEVTEPLLRKAAQKGIKAVKAKSLAYRSGKSWASGIFLLMLSFVIFGVTMYSTFKQHS